MKNLVVFFLFLLKTIDVVSQNYIISPLTPVSGIYGYKIEPNSALSIPNFADKDQITWIFPDGQYQQKEIIANAQGVIQNGADYVQWLPSKDAQTGPFYIQAYVARKGGTGNPTLSEPEPFTGTYTNNPPASLSFSSGTNWHICPSWDFSPNNETFLIVSYNAVTAAVCPAPSSDFITLQYNPAQLTLVDNHVFNNENLVSVPAIGETKISHFSYSQPYSNIFLKVKTDAATTIGTPINIKVIGRLCASNADQIPDTIDLPFVTKGGPHDPNSKTVDIDTIFSNQTKPIKLTYTVQFHNDGKAEVNKVVVTDNLPAGLDPSTFKLVDVPDMNGLTFDKLGSSGQNNEIKEITFKGSTGVSGIVGLPGLAQVNPCYSYDQTIYRFKFEVYTDPSYKKTINNEATFCILRRY